MPYFKFTRVDNFLDDINREDCFDTLMMDGETLNFKIVLASECPTDIEDCLDDFGTLNDKVFTIDSMGENDGLCALLWSRGINGERTMSIRTGAVVYDLGDTPTPVKGAFLVSYGNGTGYVLAYDIQSSPLTLDGDIILTVQGSVMSVKYGG